MGRYWQAMSSSYRPFFTHFFVRELQGRLGCVKVTPRMDGGAQFVVRPLHGPPEVVRVGEELRVWVTRLELNQHVFRHINSDALGPSTPTSSNGGVITNRGLRRFRRLAAPRLRGAVWRQERPAACEASLSASPAAPAQSAAVRPPSTEGQPLHTNAAQKLLVLIVALACVGAGRIRRRCPNARG